MNRKGDAKPLVGVHTFRAFFLGEEGCLFLAVGSLAVRKE